MCSNFFISYLLDILFYRSVVEEPYTPVIEYVLASYFTGVVSFCILNFKGFCHFQVSSRT